MSDNNLTRDITIRSWGRRLKRRPVDPEKLQRFLFPAWMSSLMIVEPSTIQQVQSWPVNPVPKKALALDKGKEKVRDEFEKALPWNLRTDRKSIKRDPNFTYGEFDLPKRGETDLILRDCEGSCSERKDLGKRKRDFSLHLTTEEIEEDFLKMAGRKPARRPKKRSKKAQQQIDDLFPGTGLSNITLDLYKVDDQER